MQYLLNIRLPSPFTNPLEHINLFIGHISMLRHLNFSSEYGQLLWSVYKYSTTYFQLPIARFKSYDRYGTTLSSKAVEPDSVVRCSTGLGRAPDALQELSCGRSADSCRTATTAPSKYLDSTYIAAIPTLSNLRGGNFGRKIISCDIVSHYSSITYPICWYVDSLRQNVVL